MHIFAQKSFSKERPRTRSLAPGQNLILPPLPAGKFLLKHNCSPQRAQAGAQSGSVQALPAPPAIRARLIKATVDVTGIPPSPAPATSCRTMKETVASVCLKLTSRIQFQSSHVHKETSSRHICHSGFRASEHKTCRITDRCAQAPETGFVFNFDLETARLSGAG